MSDYLPEGLRIDLPENLAYLKNMQTLQEAQRLGKILEARAVVCDSSHNLQVDLGFTRALMPKEECALGIREGYTRDISIISRVNKPVCFVITGFTQQGGRQVPLLSRRLVQERCQREYLSHLVPGDIIDARVTHLESFGCFVDIGCGIPSLISIDAISVSRISHPGDRMSVGQNIRAVVRDFGEHGRITLTHKELLGTWEENAALFSPGETVAGIVRSVEEYGIFVELTPNLAGLAEPKDQVTVGQQASVYIKSMIPEKMKVKLIIVDAFHASYHPREFHYFVQGNHLSHWQYSPTGCRKTVQTWFDPPGSDQP